MNVIGDVYSVLPQKRTKSRASLSSLDDPDEAEESAPHLIGSLSGAPLLGLFPRIEVADPRHVVDAVVDRIAGEPLTTMLIKELGLV